LDVNELQAALNFHMRKPAAPLKPDGNFGPLTDTRLREFQRRAGILDDGIVGPATIRALYRTLSGAVEAKLAPRNKELPQAFARGPAFAGAARSALLGVPGLGQIRPVIPDFVPPSQRVPRRGSGVTSGYAVETKLILSPLSDPKDGDHPLRFTITPNLPWPVFLPEPLQLEVEGSVPGVGQTQLEGKVKRPFKLVTTDRLELKPYFFVGAGGDQNHFKEINAGAVVNLKLKLLPNIGNSGVSVGLEADGGVKYKHDLTTGESKVKGVIEGAVVIEVLF
jgi:hypothetical protein